MPCSFAQYIIWRILTFAILSEILYEDKSFPNGQLAALVASKVYYNLGEYQESLTFALRAGSLFDLNLKTEYVETLICMSFDFKLSLSFCHRL